MYVISRVSANKTRTIVPKPFVEKMMLKSPTISSTFKINQALLSFTQGADVYCVWFTVTLVYRDI